MVLWNMTPWMVKAKLQGLLSLQGLWAAQSGRKLLLQNRHTVPGLPCTALLQTAVLIPLEIEPKLLPSKREPRCRGSCGFLNLITITCSLAATDAPSALSLRWDQHLPAFKGFWEPHVVKSRDRGTKQWFEGTKPAPACSWTTPAKF